MSETQLHPSGEEAALGACSRLRRAVDTLLELLNQANSQVATQGFHSLTDTTPNQANSQVATQGFHSLTDTTPNQANSQVATQGVHSLTDTTPVFHIILEQWMVVMDRDGGESDEINFINSTRHLVHTNLKGMTSFTSTFTENVDAKSKYKHDQHLR